MRSVVVIGLTLGLGLVASACSDEHHGGDGGESYNCAAEDRDDDFVVGLQKTGQSNKLAFKLLSATPAPPARGDNTWIVEVSAVATSTPVSGVTMVATPFMPDHQHGTPLGVVVEPMPDVGQYKLSPVNMWMPGLWQTTIEAQSGADTDKVVFAFCIPS